MAQCKSAVTPLLTHLSYRSLAPDHQYADIFLQENKIDNIIYKRIANLFGISMN